MFKAAIVMSSRSHIMAAVYSVQNSKAASVGTIGGRLGRAI